MITKDALLAYPDHNLSFHIYKDASDMQLESVIMQNKRPIAYYTRKLNPAQRNYTTIEKELLSIITTLKEFRSMLLGAEIHIYTDHRNLTFQNLTTQRVLRWRLYMKEYAPEIHYIKGEDNVIADFLSRAEPLDRKEVPGLNDPATFQENRDSMDEFLELELESSSALKCALNEEYNIRSST